MLRMITAWRSCGGKSSAIEEISIEENPALDEAASMEKCGPGIKLFRTQPGLVTCYMFLYSPCFVLITQVVHREQCGAALDAKRTSSLWNLSSLKRVIDERTSSKYETRQRVQIWPPLSPCGLKRI
ncbi:hypothetical protein Cni_G23184 [Canna indica]|uniref:Uncharacterized protein n=1 Tax=Canna indica TaxID=4628 RepID=A0AAQ3KTK6_9LILI|nr:hypothetical protein Cni_G23184 [Canna indica]